MAVHTLPSVEPAPLRDPSVPVIEFDEVSLAFDDKVVLDRVSFTLMPGRRKLVLGAN